MILASRRQVLQLALGGVGVLLVGPLPLRLTYFDARFERARRHALLLASGGPVQAMGGDATDLALRFRRLGARLHIQGVTPEAVPFCLRQLGARLEVRRLDRDLFVWMAHG